MNQNTQTARRLRDWPKIVSRIFIAALFAYATNSHAASGTWTNDASSIWSDGTNWLNGTVASGVDATADFSTVVLTTNRTVTLDVPETIGNAVFGNTATLANTNWILNASGGSVLTLAVSAGSPTVAVTNTAVVSAPLAGTAGLTKVGNGTLVLGNVKNSYIGGTTVSGGVLQLTNAAVLTTGPVLYLNFNNVGGNVVTNGGNGGAAMNGLMVGAGVSVTPGAAPNGNAALNIGSGAVNAGYVLINSSVVPFYATNTSWSMGMWMKTSTTGAVYAYQGDGGWANANTTFHLNGGTNDQGGPFAGGVRFGQGWQTGTTPLTDGNWHFVVMTSTNGVKTNYVDGNIDSWLVSGSTTMNQWNAAGSGAQFWIGGTPDYGDGNVRLNGQIAEVYVYNRAISQTEAQNLMTAVGPAPQTILPPASAVAVAASSKLDLNGLSPTVAGLSGVGIVDTTFTAGTNQLVINNSIDSLFTGNITNSSGALSLHKTGSGALALTTVNNYIGNTILDNGTLYIDNASAIGTAGTLYINGGAIDNTNGASVTVANNKPEQWAADFTFNGTTNLSFGTGGVTLSGPGTNRQVTINSNILTTGAINSGPANMGLTLAGAGTLITSGGSASTITGDLNMGPGTTIQNSQDFHSVGLTGTGTVQINGNANKWYFVNNTNTKVFSGTIQNGPGVPVTSRGLGFNKSGIGTQILNGTVLLNDTVTVNAGKLLLTGGGITITNPNSSGSVPVIAPVNGSSAVLILSNNATFMANYTPANTFNSSFNIATAGTTPLAAGSVLMYPGCTFNVAKQLTVGGGNNGSGFAAFSQFGGTTTIGGFIACGGTTNGGVFNISGGTLLMNGSAETIGYGSTASGSYGVQNIFGTAVFNMTGAGNGVWPGEVNNGTVSLWDSASLSITNDGIQFAHGNAAANGTFNLDGGTLSANFITSVNASGTFNFNGGTLRANTAGQNGTGVFTPGTSTTFFDYSGGVVFDDGGFAITFNQPINAASGFGIGSIPITSGGSNYIDTPIVLISGGSGNGAKASAQIDYGLGAVTNIFITCPGTGYANSDTLTFTIIGGGGGGLVLGTPTFAANTAGSLTKIGTGSLTLTGGAAFGGTTRVLAGNLAVDPNTFTTLPSFELTNGAVTMDVSGGSSVNANSVTLQNNATLSISLGNLTANPTFPALNTTAFSAPGDNLTINVTGLGLRPGTIVLVKYTGTPLANLANFTLVTPPGVTAALVNNTANDSVDLSISTAPQNLTWYGGISANWDINATANWNNGAANYLQYTNGSLIVGDAVTFDDTLLNQQNTNVNVTTTVSAFPVTVNSTLPYSLTGPGGIGGSGYVVMTNTGTLFVGTSNSYSGGTFIDGGSLIITNDNALGAAASGVTLAGGTLQVTGFNVTNTRPVNVTAASSIDVVTNITGRFGGAIAGSGGLTKTDDGTLILAGTNGLTGTLTVNQGTLTTVGTNVLAAVPIIGNSPGFNGVLNVAGGVFRDNNNPANIFNSSLTIGNNSGAAGDMLVSAGTVTIPKQLTIGAATYGAFSQSGGATTIGGFIACGATGNGGVLNLTGGTISQTNAPITLGYAVTTSFGVMNLSGSAALNVSGANNGVWPGEVGNGTLNLSGNAALTIANDGISLGKANAASDGTVNLNGGTITANFITNGLGLGTFNFNGGTLKANAAGTFTKGIANSTAFFDYNGGAVIDDGGLSITFNRGIQAPNGLGIATIPITSGGSGYIDTPIVAISGGNGSNATATATVSGGVVTAVTVTCPGSGYQADDVPSISFTGGGANPTPPTVGTITFVANGAGGLTKRGSGTLTLSGADTYTGSTLVSTGALFITPLHQVTGPVINSNSATFGVLVNSGGAATVGNLTLGSVATGTNFLAFTLNTGTNPTAPVLQAGTLTLVGTNWVRLGGVVSLGTFPVLKYTGAIAGTGVFNTNVLGSQGLVASLSNDVANSTLYVNVTANSGLFWLGNNPAAGSTNVWGVNSITNWQAASSTTFYQQIVPPGDAVTFNDLGSGTVLLSNSVSPSSLTISNNAVNYTFQGTGNLAGTASLVKQGTGTATISFTNDSYSGNTVISNGTLQLGSATVIPNGSSAGNVSIAAAGILDINGNSSTINGLSGAGVVNNSSGTAAVLTFGTASTGDTLWAGSFTNSGSGGIGFLKTGTNTVTVTGTNYMGGGDPQNQVNGGTMILTNGGSFIIPSGEFWIAQNAGSTGTVVVAGGTIVCSNNWIVIGRNNATANGTMIVNSGTVQKGGTTGNIVVGSLNATGTLIVNGGQVLNTGDLWLGESAAANASFYLNGGLVQAKVLRPNGTAPLSSIAYFNGGTLQATVSTNSFLQVMSFVMSNGLVLDDNGFTLGINTSLQSGDSDNGGLVKAGAGAVYLDQPNGYTGVTLVTNGTLAGVGSVAGNVVVAPAGNIGAGDASAVGTFSIGGSLNLQGKATVRVDKTGGGSAGDQIAGFTSVHFGGVLVVSNITSDATPITTSDTFQIFSAGGTGNFTSIVGSPGPGLAYAFNPSTGLLSVVAAAPSITGLQFTASPQISGTTLTISGTNTGAGAVYLLTSTNVAAPLNTWLPVWTNVFSDSSSFTTNVPNAVDPALSRQFFILSNTNQ